MADTRVRHVAPPLPPLLELEAWLELTPEQHYARYRQTREYVTFLLCQLGASAPPSPDPR